MHNACTPCAQRVHRWAVFCAMLLVMACADVPDDRSGQAIALRNPTVPIGAILRFELAKLDGDWTVQSGAGGPWALTEFSVSQGGALWRENDGRTARIVPRATGILRLTYDDGSERDVWVLWTDPDHHTLALGNPEGGFGFIATRAGRFRADQVAAAGQVLDFNGYRTNEWKVRAR